MNTGHPTEEKLTGMRWAGKTFRSTEDVDPIMVYKEDGERVWNADWGHARVSLPCFIYQMGGLILLRRWSLEANHFYVYSFARLNGKESFLPPWFMMTSRSSITSDMSRRI